MTDLQIAENNLPGHSICLCKDGECIYSDRKGIAPMMNFIAAGRDLTGYSVADIIVGKAAAMLFIKCGIKNVFAKTLSVSGKKILEDYGITFKYETLTERIINRTGTDMCPMEKAVLHTSDVEEAYMLLQNQIKQMNIKN